MARAAYRASSTGRHRPASAGGVLRLALLEVERTRRAYLMAGAVALLLGLAAAALLERAPVSVPAYAALLNLVFLVWAGALPNAGAWDAPHSSGSWSRPYSATGHLSFLRSLPLTVAQVVAARALAGCFTVLVLSAAFLGPLYTLSGTLTGRLGAGELALFAAFWAGVALAFWAVGLFTELGLGGVAGFSVYALLLLFLGGVCGGLGQREVSVVGLAAGLTRDHGALPALAALVAGGGMLALSRWATGRRLRRGDLPA